MIPLFNINKKAVHLGQWCHNPYQKFRLVLSYLPTPPLGQDMTQGQFLSGV